MKLEKRGDAPSGAEPPRREDTPPINPKKREVSVIIYTLVLFVVALALILLSYKIQQRANTTLSDITEQHGEVTAQALRNIEELQQKNLELTQELNDARDELRDAQRRMEELEASAGELKEERDALNAQIKELNMKAEDLEKSALASGTLMKLVTGTDPEDREELLRRMASLSQYLDAEGAQIYNAFIESLKAGTAEEPENEEKPNDSEDKAND